MLSTILIPNKYQKKSLTILYKIFLNEFVY
jgi:hypothetical protein